MTSIDQQFVEFIVKSLVSKPDAVVIERRIDEKGVLLELTVDPEDLGRVIGKRGATAQSIRTLLRALGTKNDARYNLKIVDVDRPGGVADEDNSSNDAGSPTNDTITPQNDVQSNPVEESTEEPVEENASVAARTRKELADMDDLDI
ncbi:MAG TPA: KH domain-containing protein [Candidatus Saccharimonas sp.]|nr:KH domain-containing protein [Candidatus Saccharimonas sp.]